jgi:hypothetical protein
MSMWLRNKLYIPLQSTDMHVNGTQQRKAVSTLLASLPTLSAGSWYVLPQSLEKVILVFLKVNNL